MLNEFNSGGRGRDSVGNRCAGGCYVLSKDAWEETHFLSAVFRICSRKINP